VKKNSFRIFPPQRMLTDFPWTLWLVGWLAAFKAVLWLAYEPVLPQSLMTLLGYKYLIGMLPLLICAVGLWNQKRWAVYGVMAVAAADIIFFGLNLQTLNAFWVEMEELAFSLILSFVVMLCNGPLGDILILVAIPALFKYTGESAKLVAGTAGA
jgi:hypothetical protein